MLNLKNKGKIYLIPCPISENGMQHIPSETSAYLRSFKYFIAEHAKTCRRFIKASGSDFTFDEIEIFELNKRTEAVEYQEMIKVCLDGHDLGLMSDAGCPGVADPGAKIVSLAHQHNIEVIPLVGPSSLLLALMASGMNGQGFSFHGYLSPKRPLLANDLKKLENLSRLNKQCQLFIETPYRNHQVVEESCKALQNHTRLCIACDIGNPNQFIKTLSIEDWKKQKNLDLHKRPAVFIIE